MTVSPIRFRVLLAVFLSISVLSVYLIFKNSGSKHDYQKVTGRVIYFSERYNSLPSRDYGKYKYLGVEGYPYIFEIYCDGEYCQLSDLRLNDTVTTYFYETSHTHENGINRFAQYIEKGKNDIYKRSGAMQITGFVLIGLCFLFSFGAYVLYRKAKIPY